MERAPGAGSDDVDEPNGAYCTFLSCRGGVPDRAGALTQRATPPETMEIQEQPGDEPSHEDERAPVAFQRQLVFFRTTEAPGTIIVHTSERYLYVVQGNNRAMRYGIGVGREGFQWQGLLRISRKPEWPDWGRRRR